MENKKLSVALFSHQEYNIAGHIRPDGDSVGSQLAIYNILRAQKIKCNIIKNDNYGAILADFFTGYNVINDENVDSRLPLICVDCSDFKRTGEHIVRKYSKPFINIDHHLTNDRFAQHNFVDPSSSSTTEVIAKLLSAEKIDFDKATAGMIYLGIMTDTGRFAYSTTTIETVKIVEKLMAKGISPAEFYQKIYERDSIQKYRLMEKFLHNIEIFSDGLCCCSFVTESDFAAANAEPLDTEGFVNYTRQLDGVKVGAFLEFHNNYTKSSLRAASEDFRIDLFAKQFGGGGHPAAAGFVVSSQNKNFYQEFKSALAEHVKNFYKNQNGEYK